MDRAAENATGDGLKPWEESVLDGLRWDWGEAYEIEPWKAKRRDGLGGWIEAPGPDDLRQAVLADYTAKKVPR